MHRYRDDQSSPSASTRQRREGLPCRSSIERRQVNRGEALQSEAGLANRNSDQILWKGLNGLTDMHLTKLTLKVEPELISAFYPMLSHGFSVCAPSGCSIKSYLCSYLGIDSDYFDNRIQTLFLDGSPVDDPDTAVLRTGSVLALSGAMPGLAGATLRRGGFYGKLRGEISYDPETACETTGECLIRVKLFNLVVKDLGPLFLERGIQVHSGGVSERLENKKHRLIKGCYEAELDGKPLELKQLLEMGLPEGDLVLQILTQSI